MKVKFQDLTPDDRLLPVAGKRRMEQRAPFSIDPAPGGPGLAWVYVDLAKAKRAAGTTWMDSPLVARLFGKNDVTMVVRDQYDGVVLIDNTWPPEYLAAPTGE